jgi:L-amino acid N-acyltransferase YncA
MQIVDCTNAAHGEAILAILNDVIATSTALFDYEPRTRDSMVEWFRAKETGRFPVLGAVESGRLLGFASYGAFRAWPAYKYTVENAVYVDRAERGKGIGGKLMRALIARAEIQNYHTLVAGIVATNAASIALHERLGFVHAGTVKQAGFKFGEWQDLAFYQLLLPTPERPLDG